MRSGKKDGRETRKMDTPDRVGYRCSFIKFLISTVNYLRMGNLVQAKESLQKTHHYFLKLTPLDFLHPSLEETEIVNKAEEISVENVAWSFRTRAVLLPQTSPSFFVRLANTVGAVALNMTCVDIAKNALEQLKEHIERADDGELDISHGVALNNLGCVYIINGSFQKAKVILQRALEIFSINGKHSVAIEEKVLATVNNLRIVHLAQRSHVADEKFQNDLISSISRFAIQPRINVIFDYNEALTSLSNRNLRKALDEFENLKTFCETEIGQSKGLLTCILLKIRSVCLMLQASKGTTRAIDTKIYTLQGLKELVEVSTNFSLDFLVTIVETVSDIHLYQGNFDLACSFFSYLVPVTRERCGADHPTFASMLFKQGLVFLYLENTARSRQCFTDALEIFTRAFGAIHPDVLKCNASLGKLESLCGFEEKSLLYSQKVLKNVEGIFQVSFEHQLKPKVIELFQGGGRTPSPYTDKKEKLKFEILISEFGVEITKVLKHHQPSALSDCSGILSQREDCVDSSVSQLFSEDTCAKLSFNLLKVGLCLLNLGVEQSATFLFLSCTYASMFYGHFDCSEVILLKVIFVVCHLEFKTSQTFSEVQERLKTEFERLKNFIEEKARRFDKPDSKNIFFEENTNLMIALAVLLQSFVEMEMCEMIDAVHSLFSSLSNQQSTRATHISLGGEIRFAFFSSTIQCVGRPFMHDLIFLTPLGNRKISCENIADAPGSFESREITKSPRKDDKSGERGSTKIFKSLMLKSDNNQLKGSCRFLVECPITRGVDVSTLNHTNVCSVDTVENSLPHLILCTHQNTELVELGTQYLIVLELLDSSKTTHSEISGGFSRLPLLLSAAKDGSEFETQSPVLVMTEKICEGSLAFILQDKVVAEFLLGKLLKQILTNENELADVVNVVVEDSKLVLKIQGPPIGQIVMQCHEGNIEVETQFIHFSQSRRKFEIVQEEVPPCNCSLIEMVIADIMKKCACGFGILFEAQGNKSWCIASNQLGNARNVSMRGRQTLELQHKAERPGRVSSLPTLPLRQSFPKESWAQTDSSSIPSKSDISTQTDLGDSHDESKNLVESTSSSSEVSTSSSLPSSSSSSSSSPSSCGEERTDEVSRSLKSRSETAGKCKSSVHSVCLCASELKRSEREAPKLVDSGEESFSMAYPSSNDIEKGQTNQAILIPPLNLKVQTDGELCESNKRREKRNHTSVWLRHCVDGEVDGSVKNAAPAKTEIQNRHPSYSLTGSVEPLFQGESIVANDLPRWITDQVEQHGGATAAATIVRCNDAPDENRRNKENKADSESLKLSQESKNKNKGDLSRRSHNTRPGIFVGLKGGGQGPSFSDRDLSYTNLETVSYWDDKVAKPEKVQPQGGDLRNTIDEKEPHFFGIKPCFLARHTDDSSITTPIDDLRNTAENANGGSSNKYSRHQRSSCFTNEQGYQGINSFHALPFHFENSKVFTNAQCPNPNGSFGSDLAVRDLLVPARPLFSPTCNGSEQVQTLSTEDSGIVVVPLHAVVNDDTLLAQKTLSPQQRKVKNQCSDPEVQRERNCFLKVMSGNPPSVSNTTSITQGLVLPEIEISALPQGAKNRNLTWETRTLVDQVTNNQGPQGALTDNSTQSHDDSLADLERRVAETCSLVEKTLKEREVKAKAMKEKERRKKEERTRKEQIARERREREASEARQTECRDDTEEASNPTSDGEETPSQNTAGAEGQQWLCEHYQRLCRVKFPCCGKFFPCHRCHNNSGCPNDNTKAREGCVVECSVCSHQQEINQDAHTCARCKTKFSAYFCSVCKHFTSTDKNPYHCTKCGICRIYKDRSFHCDVCNVCLDKRLEGRHSCRENSGHDECCICLEDAFSGCQILPCSHKVHRECAIAMIQNGVRSCPICRHPLVAMRD